MCCTFRVPSPRYTTGIYPLPQRSRGAQDPCESQQFRHQEQHSASTPKRWVYMKPGKASDGSFPRLLWGRANSSRRRLPCSSSDPLGVGNAGNCGDGVCCTRMCVLVFWKRCHFWPFDASASSPCSELLRITTYPRSFHHVSRINENNPDGHQYLYLLMCDWIRDVNHDYWSLS